MDQLYLCFWNPWILVSKGPEPMGEDGAVPSKDDQSCALVTSREFSETVHDCPWPLQASLWPFWSKRHDFLFPRKTRITLYETFQGQGSPAVQGVGKVARGLASGYTAGAGVGAP